MGIELTDRVRENARRYGIDPEQVTEAVGHESEQLDTPWESPVYTLHVGQHFDGTEPRFYVVPITVEGRRGAVVVGVHVVPAGLYDRERNSPEAMLAHLARGQFGLGVKIGGHVRPFVLGESVTLAESGTVVTLDQEAPEGHEVVIEKQVEIRNEGEARVSLAFAVDATTVREHLGLE